MANQEDQFQPTREQFFEVYDRLDEARLQIEYLQKKFQDTGTGNTVLTRIEQTLEKYKDHE